MSTVALFHSALGVRPGIRDAAAALREAGHDVLVVDQYDGRVFDRYEDAQAHVGRVGFPALMQRALDEVAALADGFIAAGFSNGAGMAQYVATQRRVAGVLMLSGALPLDVLGADSWPAGVPAQIHCAEADPFRSQAGIDAVAQAVRDAKGRVEVFDYPGAGHLFADRSLPDEHDAESTRLLLARVVEFCGRVG